MKLKHCSATLLTAALFAVAVGGFAAEEKKAEKPKPYPLKTCLVSGAEIDDKGDMKPYSFIFEGREIKFCCKGCLPDFKKDSAKFMKQLDEAEKKQKK
jgi:hypothetical protein